VNTDIEIKIDYNDTDVKKAISFLILRITGMKTAFMVIFFALAVSVAISLIVVHSAILSVIFLLAGFLFYYFYYQRPVNKYVEFYQKRKHRIYRFSDENVQMIGENVHSNCLWSVFKKSYETPSYFLLIDDNRFIYIFPKSFFDNRFDIERLRELFSKKFTDFKLYN